MLVMPCEIMEEEVVNSLVVVETEIVTILASVVGTVMETTGATMMHLQRPEKGNDSSRKKQSIRNARRYGVLRTNGSTLVKYMTYESTQGRKGAQG